jgi:hypothetical protein
MNSTMDSTPPEFTVQSEFMQFFRAIESMASGDIVPLEYWVPLASADLYLRCQGVLNPDQVRELVRLEVLSEENHTVRNVSLGKRPTYEINVVAAVHVVKTWKKLSPEDRLNHINARNLQPWKLRKSSIKAAS